MRITWFGHSAFRLDFGGHAVLTPTGVIVPEKGKAFAV